MGSLPNLHELSREKLDSPVHRPAPIGGLGPIRLPPQPPLLAHTHRRARSSGHHHNALWDNDAMLEVSSLYSVLFNLANVSQKPSYNPKISLRDR